MPFILIINFLLFLFWLSIKSRWILLSLFTLLASIPYLCSVLHIPFNKTDTSVPALTVCTYNTQGFTYGESHLTLQLFAEFVKEHNVTLLCLQEMDEMKRELADSLFEQHSQLIYHSTLSGQQPSFALAIYSAYPLIQTRDIAFSGTSNHAVMTDVLINGDTIRVFNLHLQTTHFNQKKFSANNEQLMWDSHGVTQKTLSLLQELSSNIRKRQIQVDSIAVLIKESPHPVIACGDLNTPPTSYSYWKFRHTLKDGFRTSGNGYEYTYRYLGNLFRIDYIFHDSELAGQSYQSFNLDYSDHKPVVMSLSLNK